VNTAFILIPDFILIIFAWALNRYTNLNKELWIGIEKLVYWILFPCLLLSSASRAVIDWGDNIPMLLLIAAVMIIIASIAYASKWILRPDPINHFSGTQTAFRFNTYISVACIVPLSNMLSIITLASNKKNNIWLEILRNPFLISTLIGLTLNVSGVQLPEMIHNNLVRMGNASIPLGLMAIGAGLQWVSTKKDLTLVGMWVTLKLMVLPLFVLIGAHIINLPEPQRINAIILASMPTATSAFVMATRMGGNGAIVSVTISVMTILAGLTVPFWLAMAK
jgi:predicted permease